MGQVRTAEGATGITADRIAASQDMSPLYPDVLACLSIQVLEIKKMVYLFLVNYSRVKPEMVKHALPGLLSVSRASSGSPTHRLNRSLLQDANDSNALIRALALRTMSYIPVPEVLQALVEPLRHCLKDRDPYVRKTAAICVAKMYMHDRRIVEREKFVTALRDLLMDPNPTVIANAIAALTEISERSDNIHLRLNSEITRRLVQAMGEASECVEPAANSERAHLTCLSPQMGPDLHPRIAHVLRPRGTRRRGTPRRADLDPTTTFELGRRPRDRQGHPLPHELHGKRAGCQRHVPATEPSSRCVRVTVATSL